MDINESESLCYDYFVNESIKSRDELRKSLKTNPITGLNQSFIENMFSMFQKQKKEKNSQQKQNCKLSQTICISDLHIPNQDDKTISKVFDCIVDMQPEFLVLNGDILDCYWCSKFNKNPKNNIYLQEEADIFYRMFKNLRRYIKNTKVYYVLGNHEDRLSKNQWEQPQYVGLRALEPERLLKMDRLDIQAYKAKVLINGFIYCHGDVVRKSSAYSAKAEFEAHQMNSGISGHTHRLGSYYHTYDEKAKFWFENGCLCKLNPEYIKGSVNWQQGFSVINYYNGLIQGEQILIQDRRFKYNGKLYL